MSSAGEALPQPKDESEERLRSILETTVDWIWEMDLSGRHTYCNHRVKTILGYTPPEFAAMDFKSILHPDDRADVNDKLPGLMARKEGWTGWSLRWRHKDGDYRFLESNAVPILDANGRLTGYRGTDRDVTDRMIAEQTRVESDRMHQAVLSSSPDSIMLLDVDGRIRFINRTVPDLTVEEVIGRPAWEFLQEDQRQVMSACLDRVRASLDPDHYEVSYRPRDGGSSRHFECRVFPIVQEGKVVSFVVNASDRTEQLSAEEALRASEGLYSSLAAAVPVGIFRADAAGSGVYANDKCAEMTGLSVEELLGKGWTAALHPDDSQRVIRTWMRTVETRQPSSLEHRVRHKDGRTTWVLAQWVPDSDARGEPIGFTGTITDITAQKEAEERLRHSQKLEAIGQFAGGIAHDFNNILAAILGNAELIETDASETERGIDDIKRAVARANALTKQLLAFGRKDTAKPEVLDVNDVIRDMESMLARLLPEQIQLESRPFPGRLLIHVDRRQLEQVVLNLAINARDAMPEGGVLSIESSHASDGGRDDVVLQVTDTGTGMTEDVLEHVFEPFFTTKPEGRGSGLGLATVYGIVTSLGGTITIDSTPGIGSTFTVVFPATTGAQKDVPPAPVNGSYRGNEVVLVCEDNALLRNATSRLLRANGYHVMEAQDGLEAVHMAETSPLQIDALVCDVVMPRLNGRDAAKLILAKHPDIRTVLMSGHAADLLQDHQALESHRARFLEKPFQGVDLLRTVRGLLDQPA